MDHELKEFTLSSFITYTNSATSPSEIARNKRYKLLAGLKSFTSIYGITNCSNEVRIWNPGHPTHEKVLTQECGNRQACPPCTCKFMAKHRKWLAKAMVTNRKNGGDVCSGALTISVPNGEHLRESTKKLKKTWTLMAKSGTFTNLKKKYKVIGYVRITEQKLKTYTWFPHFHLVWFFEETVAQSAIDDFGAELAVLWAKYAHVAGALNTLAANQRVYYIDLGSEWTKAWYLCKHGYFDINKELELYPVGAFEYEPFEVLEIALLTGQAEFMDKWEEFEKSTTNSSRVIRSHGLKKLLGN